MNDGTRFRNFFRLLPTNRNLAFGIVRTAREFGWRKLLVISQNEELFTTVRKLASNFKVQKVVYH